MNSTPNRPITLQVVAEAAGVSVSTASRALNGRAKDYRISQKTVDHVKAQAERLGFQPSLLAKSLQSQKSGLIGIIVPDISNSFFAAIAREVTLQAEANGLSVLLADSRDSTEIEVRLIEELRSRRVEGLVVCPVGIESQHLAIVEQSGTPLVLVDRCFADEKLTSVTSDNAKGAKDAIRLLLKHQHQVIGCLQGLPETQPNNERLAAVRESINGAGFEFDDSLVAGNNFTEQSGYEATKKLLTNRPDITALFAFSTPNAMGALRATTELNLKVPEDLSLVAFDDLPFAEFMKVPLSTVFQDVKQLGNTAAEVLITQLRTGKKPRKRTHKISVKLVSRSSVQRPVE